MFICIPLSISFPPMPDKSLSFLMKLPGAHCIAVFVAGFLAFAGSKISVCGEGMPVGVDFRYETLERKGVSGDNWCMTWAADGNLYTMMDDGSGWRDLPKWQREGSLFLQISGGPDFTGVDVNEAPGWPRSHWTSPHYGYGTSSVDGVIYVWVWKSDDFRLYSRPEANRLLYTPDFGKTFYRWNGEKETTATFGEFREDSYFFYREDPVPAHGKETYAFNWIAFCQNGRDNQLARDDFVYMYAPEQYDPRDLAVIRVHRKHIRDKSKYEYFAGWKNGAATWTADMSKRGVNLRYPQNRSDGNWMWASWFPDVVYNKGLDLYVMVSYGVSDPGKAFWDPWCSKCAKPASLGFWYSKNPYGPWTLFHYSEYFYADHEDNRTYGFKLSPKWISEDGTRMWLIWSDARDDHTTNYLWNQMELEILLN